MRVAASSFVIVKSTTSSFYGSNSNVLVRRRAFSTMDSSLSSSSAPSMIASCSMSLASSATSLRALLPSSSTVLQACGRIAPASSMVLFLAPLPTLWKVANDKSTRSLPLLPYSSMVCSSMLWTAYGFLKNDPRIWSGNAVGLVMGLLYLTIFVRNHQRAPSSTTPTTTSDVEKSSLPGTVSQHVNAVVAVAALTAYLLWKQQTNVVGILAMAFCVVMFGSPLAATKLVLQTKSSAHIPWPFTMASFTNCALWSTCGIFDMKDAAVIIPNVLGLTLSTMQVLLKWVFPPGDSTSSTRNNRGPSVVVPPV